MPETLNAEILPEVFLTAAFWGLLGFCWVFFLRAKDSNGKPLLMGRRVSKALVLGATRWAGLFLGLILASSVHVALVAVAAFMAFIWPKIFEKQFR